MDFAALFGLFQSWGPSAISSALVIVVLYLIRQVRKNNDDDIRRAEGFRELIDSKLKELRENTARALEEHGRRLSCIELEYLRRETFYRELGGWKDDINRLSATMSSHCSDINKSIMDLWKARKDQQ